jgi:hypothetical protein
VDVVNCPPWCTRTHPAGAVELAALVGHDATLADQVDEHARIRVCLVWNERTDGQPSEPPAAVVYAASPGVETELRLTAGQADAWSDLLALARGPAWLWTALAAASRALAERQD